MDLMDIKWIRWILNGSNGYEMDLMDTRWDSMDICYDISWHSMRNNGMTLGPTIFVATKTENRKCFMSKSSN